VSNRKRDRVRDYEEKRREYLAIGVSEYWIIDRFKRTLTVVRNAPGQPSEIVVQAEETYQSPLLPGFDLPLKQLLKLADDWAAANQKRKRDKNREQPN
jgi:Uma2 family endonuclease